MGFMKDLRDLNKAGKEASKNFDPVAQMRQANEQMRQMTQQTALLTSGTAASATVIALRDTGTMVNYQPVVDVDLTVVPSGGAPFPATASVIGHGQLAGLVPGASVQVRYDPADPSTVVLG